MIDDEKHIVLKGNCLYTLDELPDNYVQCVVTSPPYFSLRNYGTTPQIWGGKETCEHDWIELSPRRPRSINDVKNPDSLQNNNKGANCELLGTEECIHCDAWRGELGQERVVEEYIKHLMMIFKKVWRVLKDNGLCFVNLGDTYLSNSNVKHKIIKESSMCLVPQRFAIAMQEDGWIVRNEIIWKKGEGGMPEFMESRFTRNHEQIWMFAKNREYYFNQEVIKELGVYGKPRNKRTVWDVSPRGSMYDHHAVYPEKLIEPCILAATKEGDVVLDPFSGTGTTMIVARRYGRRSIGCELLDKNACVFSERVKNDYPLFDLL